MARITVEDCVKVVKNRFELCLIASNRAKAILSGANTSLDRKEKPSVIALREIASDLVDVDNIRKNIVATIKNKGVAENVVEDTPSDEDIIEAIKDEQESNLTHNEEGYETENVEIKD